MMGIWDDGKKFTIKDVISLSNPIHCRKGKTKPIRAFLTREAGKDGDSYSESHSKRTSIRSISPAYGDVCLDGCWVTGLIPPEDNVSDFLDDIVLCSDTRALRSCFPGVSRLGNGDSFPLLLPICNRFSEALIAFVIALAHIRHPHLYLPAFLILEINAKLEGT